MKLHSHMAWATSTEHAFHKAAAVFNEKHQFIKGWHAQYAIIKVM
jgi:hypothetical protein